MVDIPRSPRVFNSRNCLRRQIATGRRLFDMAYNRQTDRAQRSWLRHVLANFVSPVEIEAADGEDLEKYGEGALDFLASELRRLEPEPAAAVDPAAPTMADLMGDPAALQAKLDGYYGDPERAVAAGMGAAPPVRSSYPSFQRPCVVVRLRRLEPVSRRRLARRARPGRSRAPPGGGGDDPDPDPDGIAGRGSRR